MVSCAARNRSIIKAFATNNAQARYKFVFPIEQRVMAVVAQRLKNKIHDDEIVSVCIKGYAMVRPLMNKRRQGKVGRRYDYINEVSDIAAAIYESLRP